MTKRTYITKSGDTYEWEETPELVEYINQIHQNNVTITEGGRQTSQKKIKEN